MGSIGIVGLWLTGIGELGHFVTLLTWWAVHSVHTRCPTLWDKDRPDLEKLAYENERRRWMYEDEGVEPKVVVNDWEHIVETLADSFGTYLYRQTWQHRYFLNNSIYMYGSKDMSFDRIAAAVEPMGFEPTFFSDEHYFTAERGEVKLISRAEKDRVRVTLAGEDEWQTGDAAGRISETLGLVER